MKKLNVVIEQGEDGFFAFVQEIDGCTAGGLTFLKVKSEIQRMIRLSIDTDDTLGNKYAKGYEIIFKYSLESVFSQFPELNIEVLAKQTGLKRSILKSIIDGSRMATEEEAESLNIAIQSLATRLQSLRLTR
ncbi:MAG: hypothetical protein IPP15_18115 [Saprospiraceae bacterium]|uniref:HicB-like antitoxin of toxin-antitoxin system domain-containing protein n=1 Tax=Candidatus Opimibacter skivensis TaxID=2982028 RepID=A0A9D7SW11_9BACT|nr:hypothetical protein [Candidatus Opimibacter skivensis]